MLFLLATMNTAEAKKTLTVEKTQEIEAPASLVWDTVSNYETWKEWTVWNAEADPEATWSYGGEAGAVGHSSEWMGPELGEGKMVATEVAENATWNYDLYFDGKDKKYPGGLTMVEADGVTTVTWGFNMEMGGLGAALFGKKITEMIGQDFEGGLANLEVMVEAAHAEALLAAATELVAEKTAGLSAASEAVTEAEAAVAAAGETKVGAEEALKKARRKSDKAAAQTALDEATAALTAAEEAAEAARTAAATAADELVEAETALAALAPAEEAAAEEAPAEEAPAEEAAAEEAAAEEAPAEESAAPAEEAAPADEAAAE